MYIFYIDYFFFNFVTIGVENGVSYSSKSDLCYSYESSGYKAKEEDAF